jgi:AcrR family transcriptional regulator
MQKTNRQQKKELTRQKILDTALSVYARQGILVTRMSDIAAAAGVSHGTVFAHFGTQDALISAVIEDFGFKMARRIHDLVENSANLTELLAAHIEGIREQEAFYTRLVVETRNLPEIARLMLISIQSAISFHLSRAFDREMKKGDIQSVPVSLLFNTWIGLVHYYLTNSDLFAPDGSVMERYGPQLVIHFSNLISTSNTDGKLSEGENKNV